MIYGWRTTKLTPGMFGWTVYGFQHGRGETILRTGSCTTRAKASARAKAWVLFLKRNAASARDAA